ncbi:MAG: HEAT repeat domain-containing protein [Gemmataceae bacterium]|nr:HEAT repeat domain-containing protein [Gemmataceae bacterium]
MKRLVVLGVACLFLGLGVTEAQGQKKDDLPKFLKGLMAKDAKERIEACQGLGKLGALKKAYGKDGWAPLAEILGKDEDPKVRTEAAKAIGQMDADAEVVVPALKKAVESDKDRGVQIASANALAAIGPAAKDALSALREAADKAKKDLADAGDDKAKANAAKQMLKALTAAIKAVGGGK